LRPRHPVPALVACALLAAAVVALLPARRSLPAGAPHQREDGDAHDVAPDWFFAQRAYPLGTIPEGKMAEALQQVRLDRAAAALGTNTGTLTWKLAGPNNIGGRITALAVEPGGATAYFGAAMGGVFKTTNSGANWTPVFDAYGSPSIGALTLDPNHSNVVYAGAGEANGSVDSYDGDGVFRSVDGGASWSGLGLAETRRIGAIVVDPSNSKRIYVAAMGSQFSTGPDRGLYRSLDSGATWSKVLFVNDSTGVTDIAINPVHPETVFCATWERVRHYTYRRAFGPGCGIWRSVNSGTTWTKMTTGLPASNDDMGRIGLAIAPSQPGTIYAQIVSGASLGYVGLGLYRSTDGGTTWSKRDASGSSFPGSFGGFAWYFGEVAVSPLNPEVVYTCGQYLLRSTDGGQNFSNVTGNAHVDEHALWIDPSNPSHVYLGSDGGFFSSTSGGSSWTHSLDTPITQFYAGAVDPANAARLLGGAQDNDCMQTSGSLNWSSFNFGADGFVVLVDSANPSITFGEYQYGSYGAGPQRSTAGGSPGTFSSPGGISGNDRFNWCAPFVMSPLDHNTLLAGSQRVYRSRNNGVTYASISPDLTTNNASSLLVYSTITALAISPADTTVYYSGSDDGKVYVSKNSGQTWNDVSAGLPVRWVTRVTPDPVDPQGVYVTLSGFGMDERLAHVYHSSDRGDHWTSVAANLPDVPANDLIVDPAQTSRLYLATDVGVYTSGDAGGYWYPLGQGMPIQAVVDLSFHAGARKLIAATHGRSQWTLDLNDLPVAVSAPPPPVRLALAVAGPNPFRTGARLTLDLAAPASVRVAVFDALGRHVCDLEHGTLAAGRHALAWDGRDARGAESPDGVYYVRALAGTYGSQVKRLVKVR
jgi:photosystem II stability/assembly factor-like uncharacterized protein